MSLGLRQLKYFVAIADAGSLSRAAATLNVAQSALSHHLAEMEANLGVSLLERRARGVALTQAGQRFYEHARAILTALDKAEIDIRTIASSASGPITVGLCQTAVEVISLDLMSEAISGCPNVRLTLIEGLSPVLFEFLAAGQLDFAVVYNPPTDARFRAVPVLEEELFLVGSHEVIGRETTPVPLAQIPQGQIIGLSPIKETSAILQSPHLRAMIAPHANLELGSLNALVKALGAGLGGAILARATVRPHLESGIIHARRIIDPVLTRRLWILSLMDRPDTRAVREIGAILHKVLREAVAAGHWPARMIEG
jgi:LysR family nitrogen assimilation transcriptional regulator